MNLDLRGLNNLATRCSCPLVCKAWLPAARSQLYNTVCIHTPNQCLRLARTLTESSERGHLIRGLDFCFFDCYGWPSYTTSTIPFGTYAIAQLTRLSHLQF
ncbi:hypothetical protein BD311DRAFT_771519, partial [Dichomitus squalens]